MSFRYRLPSTEDLVQKVDDPAWVGCDLDGTLATYDTWKGWDHIGNPIPKMVELIKSLLNKGIKVKILTARISPASLAKNNLQAFQMEKVIQDWTEKNIGVRLPVVCSKDCNMVTCYDDSVIQVRKNTGEILGKDITLEEFDRKNKVLGSAPEEVNLEEVSNQCDWNEKLIPESEVTRFRTGIVDGGFKSCELPGDWRGSQWLMEASADNTICRIAMNSMKGILNNVEKWFIVLDIYVAAGSNRVAFIFNEDVDFRALGKMISDRTLSKVSVKL